MKRYERYKDSGIKWIGEIPEHWKTKKIKYVFTERSEKGFPNEPVLCSTQKYGVIPQSLYENRVVVVNKGLENLKRVRKGDFVISLRSFQGGIEYAYYQGIISAAYTILQLTDTANSDYLKYIFKSLDFIQLLKTCVTGIREGQNINYELLRKNSIPLPPLNEQTIIVSYLDKKISEIDSYVEKRKKLIASLSELKQSVIAKAVTKGLNPNVPMKYSGITWIGMIPEHWELKKIRNFTKMISIKGYGDMALLSVTREKGVIERNIDDKDENHNYIPDDLSGYKLVKKGQFVINKMKSWQGSYGVSDYNGIVSPAYYVCDLDFPCKAYFSIAIRSKAYIPFFTQYSKGIRVGQWDLSPIGLKNIPFIIPPREEQQAIVDYLNRKINKIEAYKKSLLSEIDYLKEYKQC
ncbi:MAG: restriction endonuclease subunit S, partial [Prevotella sp.]|nr:restriction endonuclease subunit S [Prevotella sp.]